MAAVALLVHQLMKHARTQPAAGAPRPGDAAPTTGSGGGLGGLLGGLFGGATAGSGGGLGGLRQQGLGRQVDSWISTGPNQHVSPQELERNFDPAELDEIARRAGTDRASLLAAVSRMLPELVDRMTPQGRLPQRPEDVDQHALRPLLEDADDSAGTTRREGGEPRPGRPV
jgi:uncharacterized protein YidB (DUF937 family)